MMAKPKRFPQQQCKSLPIVLNTHPYARMARDTYSLAETLITSMKTLGPLKFGYTYFDFYTDGDKLIQHLTGTIDFLWRYE